jgi:Zn-dependent protease
VAGTPPGRPSPQGSGSGLRIARPFGIPVYISPYWFLIAGLFVYLYGNSAVLAGSSGVRYVVAAAFVVLLYVSVLIHELSHSLVARGFGLPVRRILLYPLGGFSEIEQEPPTPGREFLVSAAGPLLSLVLAALGYAVLLVTHLGGLPGLLIQQLVWANLLVGIFNLLPGLPLDGGRMLRAGVWKLSGKPVTATIVAAWAGRVLAVAVLVVPVALLLAAGDQIQIFDVVWFGVIAAFMWTGASQSLKVTRVRERLPGLQARTLARRAIPIPASLPLAEAIRRADAAGARALVIVDHDDKPIAIVNENAVMATPPQRRPWVDAGSLARTIDSGLVLPADLSGMDLLEAVRRAPATEYLLVEPSGQVYGVLSASDLDHAFAGV